MSRYLFVRIVSVFVLLTVLAVGPWQLFVAGIVAFTWFFRYPLAAIGLGALADVAYGATAWFGGWPPFLMLALACWTLTGIIRTRVRAPRFEVV